MEEEEAVRVIFVSLPYFFQSALSAETICVSDNALPFSSTRVSSMEAVPFAQMVKSYFSPEMMFMEQRWLLSQKPLL